MGESQNIIEFISDVHCINCSICLSSCHSGLNTIVNRPQCLLGWRADGYRRPGFKSRSERGFFSSIRLAGMLWN